MANRFFSQFRLSLEKQVVDLYAAIDISASATPALIVSKSKGIASVSYSATGVYTITLQDKYVRLLNVTPVLKIPSGAVNVSSITVTSETVATNRTIVLQTWVPATTTQAAGLETTGVAGAQLLVTISLSNTQAV